MSTCTKSEPSMRMIRIFCSLALMGVSVLVWGHYTNTSPNSIHACVSKTTKVVRIVGAGSAAICASGEKAMHWGNNASGFRGAWSQGATYMAGDVVLLSGFSGLGNTVSCVFLATADSVGLDPIEHSNPEKFDAQWRLLAPEGCQKEAPVDSDLAETISPSTNPSGPWSLGWISSLSADLVLYSNSDTYPDGFAWGGEDIPGQLKDYGQIFVANTNAQTTLGPTVTLGSSNIVWFPVVNNPTGATVVRFTALAPGDHEFNVTWGGGSGNTCRGGPNVRGFVRHNLNLLKEINLQPYNFSASASFVDVLTLNAGDTVDFLLANPQGYDGNCNFTGLSARVRRQ